MKHIIKVLYLLVVISIISSCDNELDITSDYKDITIAYGVLNPNDSIHYLKITKAFLGDGNALEYAQIHDSSSYVGDLDVRIIELNGNETVREIQFDTTTIYNKNPGDSIFYFPEQLIYRTNSNINTVLNPDYTYQLHIENIKTGKIVTATTNLIGDFFIQQPSSRRITIENEPNEDEEIRWKVADNAKRHKIAIHFSFLETFVGGEDIYRTLVWDNFRILDTEEAYTDGAGNKILLFHYPSASFYEFLENKLPYEDENLESNIEHRIALGFEFFIYNTDNTLYTYMILNRPSGSFLQEVPEYSNINNGLGVFASRSSESRTYGVSPHTEGFLVAIESLKFIKNPEK